MITAKRTSNGVEQGIEEREISGGEHTLSSVYVRGTEKISIECKFSGDAMPRHTIVNVELRLCKNANARIITDGGGGGSGGGSGEKGKDRKGISEQ